MFEFIPVELEDVKLLDVFDAVSVKTEVPIYIDHYRIEAKPIDLANLRVSHPSRQTTWGLLLKRVTNPAKLNAFLTSVTDAMTVDRDFSLLSMAIQFRGLRSQDLVFMTSPFSGTDTIDGQSVVVSDRTKALALFDAVARDQVADWLAKNPTAKSPDTAAGQD